MSTERAYSVQDARDLFARWENGHANEADLAGGLHALIDALSTPPANSHLVNGLYRNDLGAELHVTGGWITPMGSRVMSVGGIYVAESRDRLFGTVTYHVTPESMRAARYELIEASAS